MSSADLSPSNGVVKRLPFTGIVKNPVAQGKIEVAVPSSRSERSKFSEYYLRLTYEEAGLTYDQVDIAYDGIISGYKGQGEGPTINFID